MSNTAMHWHRTGAVTHALVAVWLSAGVAGNAVADDAPAPSIDAAAAEEGGALFNPFDAATDLRVRAQPRAPDSERDQGVWALPLVAATAGFAGIAVLMRKMIG